MSLKVYQELEQGSPEWLQARCGILTASTIGRLLTPKGKMADNDKSRALLLEMLAQRVSTVVDDTPTTFAMERGHEDEIEARILYEVKEKAPVSTLGFMVRSFGSARLGYSPDGIVGEEGLIEVKSRNQRLQTETILSGEVPEEFMAQIQTGLLVSGRAWLDFISYPARGAGQMMVRRVLPDPAWQTLLIEVVTRFERLLAEKQADYEAALKNRACRFHQAEYRPAFQDIHV